MTKRVTAVDMQAHCTYRSKIPLHFQIYATWKRRHCRASTKAVKPEISSQQSCLGQKDQTAGSGMPQYNRIWHWRFAKDRCTNTSSPNPDMVCGTQRGHPSNETATPLSLDQTSRTSDHAACRTIMLQRHVWHK